MTTRLHAHLLAISVAALIGSTALADPPTQSTAVVRGPAGDIEDYDDPYYNEAISQGISGSVGDYGIVAKAQAGVGVLKNYSQASIEHDGIGIVGTAPWYSAEATSQYTKQLIFNAPSASFWNFQHSYFISLNLDLAGTITKSLNSEVNISYKATLDGKEKYLQTVTSPTYDNTKALTGFAYSESFDVQWNYALSDATWTDDDSLLVDLDVRLYTYAGGRASKVFNATADFFNTAELNTISLLKSEGGGAPVLVTKFDAQGNFLQGDPSFTMGETVPEPASVVLMLLAVPVLLRRRSRAS